MSNSRKLPHPLRQRRAARQGAPPRRRRTEGWLAPAQPGTAPPTKHLQTKDCPSHKPPPCGGTQPRARQGDTGTPPPKKNTRQAEHPTRAGSMEGHESPGTALPGPCAKCICDSGEEGEREHPRSASAPTHNGHAAHTRKGNRSAHRKASGQSRVPACFRQIRCHAQAPQEPGLRLSNEKRCHLNPVSPRHASHCA